MDSTEDDKPSGDETGMQIFMELRRSEKGQNITHSPIYSICQLFQQEIPNTRTAALFFGLAFGINAQSLAIQQGVGHLGMRTVENISDGLP